jgi:hypothetical protein
MKNIESRWKGVYLERSRGRCLPVSEPVPKCCSRREEGPVALKQMPQAVIHLLCSNLYLQRGRSGSHECSVSGNYCGRKSRSSSTNDCILVETVVMSETNVLEVTTPCSFIYRFRKNVFSPSSGYRWARLRYGLVKKRECPSFVTTHSSDRLTANLNGRITTTIVRTPVMMHRYG